jgi:hypothetical protein
VKDNMRELARADDLGASLFRNRGHDQSLVRTGVLRSEIFLLFRT